MEFKVKKDSWHYRWMKYYRKVLTEIDSENQYTEPEDFCSYWRAVLLWPGLRITTSIGLNIIIASLLVINIFFLTKFAALTVLGLIGFILIFLACIFGALLFSEGKKKLISKLNNDEFLSAAYDSYKNKFCKKVTYEE